MREIHGEAARGVFKDAYAVEFLDLPNNHSEADLQRGLIGQLRAFLTELGGKAHEAKQLQPPATDSSRGLSGCIACR